MAAKDYHICPAMTEAYIAKVSKKTSNLMLQDRKIITDAEIMNLITWWTERKCLEVKDTKVSITSKGEKILTITPEGKLFDRIKKNLEE